MQDQKAVMPADIVKNEDEWKLKTIMLARITTSRTVNGFLLVTDSFNIDYSYWSSNLEAWFVPHSTVKLKSGESSVPLHPATQKSKIWWHCESCNRSIDCRGPKRAAVFLLNRVTGISLLLNVGETLDEETDAKRFLRWSGSHTSLPWPICCAAIAYHWSQSKRQSVKFSQQCLLNRFPASCIELCWAETSEDA